MPTATDAELAALLTGGELSAVGRISGSSNGALLCSLSTAAGPLVVIHKPELSERPLWDYPDGTLAARERAAYVISAAGDFGVVPPTVLRDGPFGRGSVQLWVGELDVEPDSEPGSEPDPVVDVTAVGEVAPDWLVVLEGHTPDGDPVAVSHSPEPALRTVAVFDAVLNNSDRKGGHLIREGSIVRGCDHGVSLGVEPKLRTVLWGWAGQGLPEADLARLEGLLDALRGGLVDELEELLTVPEVAAVQARVAELLRARRHPLPTPGWPAIPWPAL